MFSIIKITLVSYENYANKMTQNESRLLLLRVLMMLIPLVVLLFSKIYFLQYSAFIKDNQMTCDFFSGPDKKDIFLMWPTF